MIAEVGMGKAVSRQILTLLFVIVIFPFQYVCAGVLDNFEKDATKDNTPAPQKTHKKKDVYYPDTSTQSHGGASPEDPVALFLGASKAISYLVASSFIRVDYYPEGPFQSQVIKDFRLSEREPGEQLIPYFRLDYHYQNIESDVDASDIRLVAGYGGLAFMGRKTFLREDEPFDKLRIDQFYGVLRLSFTDYVELGLGFGEYRLVGKNRNSGFSFTMPVTIQAHKNIAVEFIPAWASINNNEIGDYDLGVLIGTNYISLKTGFRWIESPNDHLRGPYVGLSIYY